MCIFDKSGKQSKFIKIKSCKSVKILLHKQKKSLVEVVCCFKNKDFIISKIINKGHHKKMEVLNMFSHNQTFIILALFFNNKSTQIKRSQISKTSISVINKSRLNIK